MQNALKDCQKVTKEHDAAFNLSSSYHFKPQPPADLDEESIAKSLSREVSAKRMAFDPVHERYDCCLAAECRTATR